MCSASLQQIPVARADIPEGIILSREVDSFIREEEIKDTALPLYEGRMIGQFDFSQKGWVSGKGRTAVWRDIEWEQTNRATVLDGRGRFFRY